MSASPDALAALRRLEGELVDGRRMTVAELVDALGTSGFPLLFVVLALPPLIPVPGPWGMIFGLLVVVAALQCAFGLDRLRLPGPFAAVTVPAGALRGVLGRALPLLERLGRHFRAGRRDELAGTTARRLTAVLIAVLGVAVALPIPFGNVPPVVAIVALSVSLMMRDGTALVLSGVAGLAAIAWSVAIVVVGAGVIDGLIDLLGGWRA